MTRVIPTHCPLCTEEVSKRGPAWNKSPSCDDCGIFWCHDCERWRGWEKGADDDRWTSCDNCAMPSPAIPVPAGVGYEAPLNLYGGPDGK